MPQELSGREQGATEPAPFLAIIEFQSVRVDSLK
jgi:hypothetical protein